MTADLFPPLMDPMAYGGYDQSWHGIDARVDLITPPTGEPMLWEEVTDHLRAMNTEDAAYIQRLIPVARRALEYATRRSFMPQTLQLVMGGFPGSWSWPGVFRHGSALIRVPRPPIISIDSIVYLSDGSPSEQTLDAARYQVDLPYGPNAGYGRIRPVAHQCWPQTVCHTFDAVRVTYQAGYVDRSSPPQPNMPADLKHAMLLVIGELYKSRSESVPVGNAPALIRARSLWAPYRVY